MKRNILLSLAIAMSVLSAFSQDITTNLIAHYTFDNNVNNSAPNTAGSYNGTIIGASTYTPGKIGQAFDFNGASYIKMNGLPNLNTSFTFSAWIYNTNQSSELPVVLNYQAAGGVWGLVWQRLSTEIRVYNSFGFQNPQSNISGYENLWTHIVVVWNNGTLDQYKNGIKYSQSATSSAITSSNFLLTIGARLANGITPEYFFKGKMDQVKLYTRALTQSDVNALYNEGSACSDVTPPAGVTVSATPTTGIAGTSSIDLSGTATDNVAVTKMQWFNGTTQIGSDDNTSPFGISYIFPAAGTYAITSKAFDACGNNTLSSSTSVTISPGGGSGSGNAWSSSDLSSATFRTGRVHIGQANTNIGSEAAYGLYVLGGIKADKIKIELSSGGAWADYIFKRNFYLIPIKKLEQFIKIHQHLPNFPSESNLIKAGGYEIGDMIKRQQEGIESLYLYVIELENKLENMKLLEKRVRELELYIKNK